MARTNAEIDAAIEAVQNGDSNDAEIDVLTDIVRELQQRQEVHLRPEDDTQPLATAVIVPMDEGDLIIGVRPFGSHPDSEYAIVSIKVEVDGTLLINVAEGDGGDITKDVIRVEPPQDCEWSLRA